MKADEFRDGHVLDPLILRSGILVVFLFRPPRLELFHVDEVSEILNFVSSIILFLSENVGS